MDTLDIITFDLSEVLSEEHHVELVERMKLATYFATIETLLRLSLKSPDGGADIRRRLFQIENPAARHYPKGNQDHG
jgi:hypothetical protein